MPLIPFFRLALPRAAAALFAASLVVSCATSTDTPQAESGKAAAASPDVNIERVVLQAYRAIGVPLYSSATFAFAPELALAFYNALERDDDVVVAALLREFFHPLVRLRDTVPGYAVSLIKAGVIMEGIDAGPVRPPLVMPSAEDTATLADIVKAGRAVIASELAVEAAH